MASSASSASSALSAPKYPNFQRGCSIVEHCDNGHNSRIFLYLFFHSFSFVLIYIYIYTMYILFFRLLGWVVKQGWRRCGRWLAIDIFDKQTSWKIYYCWFKVLTRTIAISLKFAEHVTTLVIGFNILHDNNHFNSLHYHWLTLLSLHF